MVINDFVFINLPSEHMYNTLMVALNSLITIEPVTKGLRTSTCTEEWYIYMVHIDVILFVLIRLIFTCRTSELQ